MQILIKQACIADVHSPFHKQTKDILIDSGQITSIDDTIAREDHTTIIEAEGLYVSPGWVDLFTEIGEPGYEYKETFESARNAATAGGYTHVLVTPNASPARDHKSAIEQLVKFNQQATTTLLPMGAITQQAEGKLLAEMYDMYEAGAVAFSDGKHPLQDAGILLKALQYVSAVQVPIIQIPDTRSLSKYGLMHEGIASTKQGLPGIPDIAETIALKRDIELAAYTNAPIHFVGVTSMSSLQLINDAKKNGIQVSASISPWHLMYCDEDLELYDTNLKLPTPLRSRNEMLELRNAVKNGLIDAIASMHIPVHSDKKDCEFEYADAGMIGLQTCYGILSNWFDPFVISEMLANGPRSILNLKKNTIIENAEACITMFQPNKPYTFNLVDNKSLSKNSALFGQTFKGSVLGIIHNNKLSLHDA